MKYLGEETEIEVKTKCVRKVEYIRCDGCGKKIKPHKYRDKESSYVRIHTWHNDWGNDSVESHEYGDYCKECAKSFVAKYIDDMNGTEELEFEHKNLFSNEQCNNHNTYTNDYRLVKNDKEGE